MIDIIVGDCRDVLAGMPAESVQCCVTSPPYFGLRDYGVDGQIGLESTPDAYIAEVVAVFREVRRVLRDDGTLWLNLGDTYAGGGRGGGGSFSGERRCWEEKGGPRGPLPLSGLKPKDRMMIPSRVALALQADGWWLRDEIVWHKPSPMPESVTDRTTKAHEMVYLLAKSGRYFFDQKAIAEPANYPEGAGNKRAYHVANERDGENANLGGSLHKIGPRPTRNRRSVWTIAAQPFAEAHFATMPPNLADLCIRAGSRPGDMVLDPFGGAGTTGLAADRLQRDATIIEMNPAYAEIARIRINGEAPLFAAAAE